MSPIKSFDITYEPLLELTLPSCLFSFFCCWVSGVESLLLVVLILLLIYLSFKVRKAIFERSCLIVFCTKYIHVLVCVQCFERISETSHQRTLYRAVGWESVYESFIDLLSNRKFFFPYSSLWRSTDKHG